MTWLLIIYVHVASVTTLPVVQDFNSKSQCEFAKAHLAKKGVTGEAECLQVPAK